MNPIQRLDSIILGLERLIDPRCDACGSDSYFIASVMSDIRVCIRCCKDMERGLYDNKREGAIKHDRG